ncbi:hypothetical protein [Caballeronia sp. ATUFL_M2_KS44]|uniref:hypothetical protein n=1 Tax=Caballeronia sp. ATUFL_M2_KS44 TaxID=2921767 RepID=UPI0020297A0A|nr:hypothetical protein [Caballeronia sp. ATUFL_M2_KS44]
MSTETYERNGHVVQVTIDSDATGQCTWSYTIDADGFTEMRDRPVSSSDEALEAARNHANAKADLLPPAESSK